MLSEESKHFQKLETPISCKCFIISSSKNNSFVNLMIPARITFVNLFINVHFFPLFHCLNAFTPQVLSTSSSKFTFFFVL